MTIPTWVLEADLNQDGSYEVALTSYVERDLGELVIDRGMGRDGVYKVSQLAFILDNADGRWTPTYRAGPYYGQLEPGAPIRLRATFLAAPYTLYTGYVLSWTATTWPPGRGKARVVAQCIAGLLAHRSAVNVTAASRTTGAAVTAIAQAAGLGAPDYSIDTGDITLPLHYVRNQEAIAAMVDVLRSEMGGSLHVLADGRLRFEALSARLGATPDRTWGTGTNFKPSTVELELSGEDLIDECVVQPNIFATGAANQVVIMFSRNYTNGESLALAAGEVWEADIDYAFPITALTSPVSGQDYTANDAADGSGTDRTSSLAVTVTDKGAGATVKLRNGHSGTIYVTWFQLRGQPEEFPSDRPRFIFSKPRLTWAAPQSVTLELPFADDSIATRSYATSIVYRYRYPWPLLTLTYPWINDTVTAEMLAVELGDLVLFDDRDTGGAEHVWLTNVYDLFYVMGLKHSIRPPGAEEPSSTEVLLAPSWLWRDCRRSAWDTFNRPDTTGSLGVSTSVDTWAGATSSFDIVSEGARANTNSESVAWLDVGASATDHIVEAYLTSMGSGDLVGIVGRLQDSSNFYYLYLDKDGGQLYLKKRVAAATTQLASAALTVGTAREIRLMIRGSRLQGFVDGRLYIDTTDSSLTTGTKAGIYAQNAASTTRFEDTYAEAC